MKCLKRFSSSMPRIRRDPSVVLVVADPKDPNVKVLRECMKSVDDGTKFYLGNNVDSLKDVAGKADVVVHGTFAGGKASVIEELYPMMKKNLRWVHSLSTGVDGLVPHLKKCDGGNYIVSNAKGAFDSSLAEWCISSFFYFNKQIPRIMKNRENRKWDKFVMCELRGSTVGFVGFGSIAQTTARLCRALGMNILALRRNVDSPGSELADKVYSMKDKLKVFAESDFVVCSLPGTPSTLKFCGEMEFKSMRKNAIFVSIGRGTCVDEDALCHALKTNTISGAALDVFFKEPLGRSSSLWDCENILITAHNADFTRGYMEDTWDVFLKNYACYREGKTFPTVSLELGY